MTAHIVLSFFLWLSDASGNQVRPFTRERVARSQPVSRSKGA